MVSCSEKTKNPGALLRVRSSLVPIPDTLTITAVGDIMLGSNYPSRSGLPEKNILEKITPVLRENTQILLGNLEGTLFDSGGIPKECHNPDLCFVFRMPFSYGEYLQKAGFDFLSIANNHSGDFGYFGRKATQKNLDLLGIHYAGILKQCEYSLKEKDGTTYAFIGAGHNGGLVSIKRYSDIKRIIRKVRPQADVIIVMFHGGGEGIAYQHVPHKEEEYAGENRGNVVEFAHVCIDAGADIVFGSGPHVTRAIELYKNKFIAYSLGNFATYGNFNLKGANGKAPILKINVSSNGNFISGNVISTYQIEDTKEGPGIDPENQALKYIQTLTREDFPDGKLEILDSGEIRKL
jgi:poly-gamma-glutamate capsule biosynthesis protein CapA/YwtB (metallophosphatase superfamily)